MPFQSLRNPLNYTAFLFPLIAVVGNKLLVVVMLCMALAAAFLAWPWKLKAWRPLLVAFGLLLLWSLLSALWSINPVYSLLHFGRLLGAVAAGLLLCHLILSLREGDRADIARWLSAGLLAASALVFLRHGWLWLVAKGSVPNVNFWLAVLPFSAIAVLSVFVLLATLETHARSRFALAAIAAAIGATALDGSHTSSIALIAGVATYAAALWLGRRFVRVLAVVVPILFLTGPLTLEALHLPAWIAARGWSVNHSAAHRMIIWRYVTGKILEKPILGWGLQTARFLPDREKPPNDDPRYADIMGITNFAPGTKIELLPQHPHDATLHLLLELGIVGDALYAAIYALCLLALLRAPLSRAALAGGAGLTVGIFVIAELSFSAWQSWWLSTQFTAVALYLAVACRGGPAFKSS